MELVTMVDLECTLFLMFWRDLSIFLLKLLQHKIRNMGNHQCFLCLESFRPASAWIMHNIKLAHAKQDDQFKYHSGPTSMLEDMVLL